MPSQWSENHVSAILSRATSSNFVCLTLGGAFVQLRVLLLLSLLGGFGFAAALFSESSALANTLALSGDLRSFDDLECSSLFSRWERIFAEVLSAWGRDSSSIAFPRVLGCGEERAKLRREMP